MSIQPYTQPQVALPATQSPAREIVPGAPVDPTGGRLVAWAASMVAAKQLADALTATGMVPKQYQGNPDDGAAAIMYGDEIGLSPTQSLQSINVVHGTPGLDARTMVALVLAAGHEVWTESETPAKVVVCGRRRGSSRIERAEWDMPRAERAGYATRNSNYKTKPVEMLYARAAATVCRRVAPDALKGLSYATAELEDDAQEPQTTTVTAAAPQSRRVSAPQAAPAAPPEPELDDEAAAAAAEPEASEAPALRSEAQSRALFAGLRAAGMADRAAGLAWISSELDREVESTKTLTKAEASQLIDTLKELKEIEEAEAEMDAEQDRRLAELSTEAESGA